MVHAGSAWNPDKDLTLSTLSYIYSRKGIFKDARNLLAYGGVSIILGGSENLPHVMQCQDGQ